MLKPVQTDMPTARRILWGIGTPRTMRPHWALHELSLTYATRPIQSRSGETLTAEFTAMNPRQKIPVLQDGDFVIAESAAIIAYLSDSYANETNALAPSGRAERARWLEWCFFIMTELDATSLYVVRRHVGLKDVYGEAPAAVESARTYFVKQLAHVDKALRQGSSYLLGEQFTTADILLTTCLVSAVAYQFPIYDSCLAYLQRTTARAAYRAGFAANHPHDSPSA